MRRNGRKVKKMKRKGKKVNEFAIKGDNFYFRITPYQLIIFDGKSIGNLALHSSNYESIKKAYRQFVEKDWESELIVPVKDYEKTYKLVMKFFIKDANKFIEFSLILSGKILMNKVVKI